MGCNLLHSHNSFLAQLKELQFCRLNLKSVMHLKARSLWTLANTGRFECKKITKSLRSLNRIPKNKLEISWGQFVYFPPKSKTAGSILQALTNFPNAGATVTVSISHTQKTWDVITANSLLMLTLSRPNNPTLLKGKKWGRL